MADFTNPDEHPGPTSLKTLETEQSILVQYNDWVWDEEAGRWRPGDDPQWVWDETKETWGYDASDPDHPPPRWSSTHDEWTWVEDEGKWVRPPDHWEWDTESRNWVWNADDDEWVYDWSNPDQSPSQPPSSVQNGLIGDSWVWDEGTGRWRPQGQDPNWSWNEEANEWDYDLSNSDRQPPGEDWQWGETSNTWIYAPPYWEDPNLWWDAETEAWEYDYTNEDHRPNQRSFYTPDGSQIGVGSEDWVWDDDAGIWRPSDDPNWVWDENAWGGHGWQYNYSDPDHPPPSDWTDERVEEDTKWAWDEEAGKWREHDSDRSQPPTDDGQWLWDQEDGVWREATPMPDYLNAGADPLSTELGELEPVAMDAAQPGPIRGPVMEVEAKRLIEDTTRAETAAAMGRDGLIGSRVAAEDVGTDAQDNPQDETGPVRDPVMEVVPERDLAAAISDSEVSLGEPTIDGSAPAPVEVDGVMLIGGDGLQSAPTRSVEIGVDLSPVLDPVEPVASEGPDASGIRPSPIDVEVEVASLAEGPVAESPAGMGVDNIELSAVPTADEGADRPAFPDEPLVEAAPGLFSVEEPAATETLDQPPVLPEVSEPFDVASDPGLDELDPDDPLDS